MNVADTITVGIAGSVRQEVQTMLCSQDWGRDIWALVLAKEFREECRQALNNKQYTFVRNVKAKQGKIAIYSYNETLLFTCVAVCLHYFCPYRCDKPNCRRI